MSELSGPVYLNTIYDGSYFAERGVAPDVFRDCFLGTVSPGAENYHLPPFLLNSPTFPVYNINGELKGYGFRTGLEGKKYMIYGIKKKEQLYGIHVAAPEIVRQNRVFIVEGYFDVLIPMSKGIKNVVSIFGNRLSVEQMYLLASLTDNFTFVLDSDPSGMAGEVTSIALIKKYLPHVSVDTRFVYPYKDIADMLNMQGGEGLGMRERV